MKNKIKLILQKLLGFKGYLFVFSIFKIFTLKYDKKEGVFLELLNHLKEDSVVLDIGANIGIMTILLAKKCSRGKVYAFEPIDENYATLIKVLRFFKIKNVIAHKIALGDKNQTVSMILPIENSVKLQGLPHVINSIETIESGIKYEVEQKTLDSMWDSKTEKIAAIKIDVENYEYSVFKGASNLLKKNMPIIYAELWNNEKRNDSFELLGELGYNTKVFHEGKLLDFNSDLNISENFFFIPKSREKQN